MSRSFAELRVKMGKKADDQASIPSDITEDEWAEIQRFEAKQFKEDKMKEKKQFQEKKQMVRGILDQQMRDRKRALMEEQRERKEWEVSLLAQCKREVEEEKRQKEAIKTKIRSEKQMMDKQLEDAEKKRTNDMQKERTREKVFVKDLQNELQQEKDRAVQKRK